MNADESDFLNDNKFRNFTNQVDKCLKGFESSSEWADLITNLGKLIKLLQTNAKFPLVPRKQLVGKRLSQCLHPALPAGVHMKALECLDVIFKNIGPRRLADDLFIYCNGVFPLLSPSAMHIKKPLFDLYENHFIPLNIAIRPAFVGLLQGLLPGLEEGAEFYERGNAILEKFAASVEPIYFYTCLWQVMLQAPSVRTYGTAFLLNHFNRRQSTDDQLYFFGNSVSLMLNSLTHILNDQQVLVQRQALDFVLFALNMHRSQLTEPDREKLCAACLTVLLRRDMALNRRFYSWLMGINLDRACLIKYVMDNESAQEQDMLRVTDNDLQLKYFKKYSRNILIAALKRIIDHPQHTSGERLPSIKPFRIITTLMDRSEIGGDIIEDVLFSLIVYLEKEYFVLEKQSNESSKIHNFSFTNVGESSVRESMKSKINLQEEFLKTANLFFANLDSTFFWNYLNKLFLKALNQEVIPSQFQNFQMTISHICDLVKFILIRLPIETYSDVHSRHLPVLLGSLTDLLVEHVPNLGLHNIKRILQVYKMIFEKVFQSASTTFESSNFHNPNDLNSSGANLSRQPSLSVHSPHLAHKNNFKIISHSINKFREFTRKFFIYVLGCTNEQISQCVHSLFSHDSKKTRISKLDKVLIVFNSLTLPLSIDEMVVEVYQEICELLVEMTSFPLYSGVFENGVATDKTVEELTCTVDNHSFPQWLVCLITSACFIKEFSIKSISMSTLLDLIYASRLVYGSKNQSNVTKTINMKKHIASKGRSLSYSNESKDLSDTSTVVNINKDSQQQMSSFNIILSLLPEATIDKLDNETNFFTLAGLSLWDYLSANYPQCHQVTVDLINRLHKTAPSASICEELILQKMLADNLEECLDSHRRFILLWQLLAKQEVSPNTNSSNFSAVGNMRTFDKCTLVLLDSLDHSSDSGHGLDILRTLCQSWLEQAFQDGHAHKIINPLLLALLKPDTTRISLPSLINLSSAKKFKESIKNDINLDAESCAIYSEEKRIYAISNENGSIKYHLKPKSNENLSNHIDNHNDSGPMNHYDAVDSEISISLRSNIAPNISIEPTVKESMEEVITSVMSGKDALDNWDNNSYLEEDVNGVIPNQNPSNVIIDPTEMSIDVTDFTNQEFSQIEGDSSTSLNYLIHPLHNHLLVYCSIYDSNGVLYSLSRLRVIFKSLPGIIVPVLENLISIDTDINTRNDGTNKPKPFYHNKILEVLSRHSNALKGNNFYQSPTLEELMTFKNYNHLQIIMVLCSWFMCSYYPVTDSGIKVSTEDIFENKKVQILAAEILDHIIQEMLTILQIGYVNHRGDFVTQSKTKAEIKTIFKSSFDKCTIAKFVLHCLSTSITLPDSHVKVFSDSVISLNERDLDQRVRDAAQVTLMRLSLNVLKLDYGLNTSSVLNNSARIKETENSKALSAKPLKTEVKLPLPVLYNDLFSTFYKSSYPYIAVSRQSILLTSIVACIAAVKLRHLHSYCYQFIISSLGVWGRSTSAVLMPIVKRLCKNVRLTAKLYDNCTQIIVNKTSCEEDEINTLPLDYSLSTLSCLKAVCHFLLLDEALKSYQLQEEKGSSSEQSFFGALFNKSKDSVSKEDSMSPGNHILEARNGIIQLMARLVDSLLILWEKASLSETDHYSHDNIPPSWTMGRPDKVRQKILSIIKPLLQQHPTIILISIAKVWPQLNQFMLVDGSFSQSDLIQDVCLNEASTSHSIRSKINCDQYRVICILELARGWKKSFSIVQIIGTCRDIIRKPFPNNTPSKKLSEKEEGQVKVNLLEFLQCFLITESSSKLSSISVTLFGLLRESSTNLPLTAAFILLKILSDFISKVSISEERREQREIQDLCQKVLENVAIIAGSSLEQPSWFRRAAQLKIDNDIDENQNTINEISNEATISPTNTGNEIPCDVVEVNGANQNMDIFQSNTNRPIPAAVDFRGSRNSLSALAQNSETSYKMATINIRCTPSSKTLTLQALNLLTMHLASILDVIYKSEEKERVQPFLSSVIFPNVLPYLRYRSVGNALNFRIASQLMASLSSYQHTRRSWRKEIFDLLFEPYFFQLDIISLKAWKNIIDNLMTQDKNTFKEAYTKLTVNQGGGLNIFTNKEAEYDQSAVCMKKLAFIIYSSELDQYVKSMPEIQEKLSDSIRLGMIPQIETQIFLCFRVLLMRISHQHLTSLWQIVIPTLTAVLQSLVDDIKCDIRSVRYSEISRRLPMYLSACKLLDMILLMNEESVPQFLYYKWAFVGNLDEPNSFGRNSNNMFSQLQPTFRPYLELVINAYIEHYLILDIPVNTIEISQEDLFNEKPLISRQTIHDLSDLAPFFFTASLRNDLNQEARAVQYGIKVKQEKDIETDLNSQLNDRFFSFENEIETLLDCEFIEPLNKS